MDLRNQRKTLRKVKRCEETLEKHENILISNDPTNTIFIGNGGLGCNIQREILMEVFSEYGNVQSIVMLPEKPYAFVVFHEVEEANKALNKLNGQKLKSGHVFYLSFIANQDVPELKPKQLPWPNGLILIEDFISEKEEHTIMNIINIESIINDKSILKHRRVKHYGYEFIYGSNNIDKNKALKEKIPEACLSPLQRLVGLGHIPRISNQLTVNHYLPGQGIPPHIDTHSAFEDGIVSISLGSQVVMDFYCPGKESVPVLLPRRSALIMLGESRYLWKHGITPRKTDVIPCKDCDGNEFTLLERSARTSLTFRLVRDGECCCDYPDQCDSQSQAKSNLDDYMNEKEAEELEKKFVNQVYDKIAGHFSETRFKPWPKVTAFLSSIPKGSFVLDIGCGNGKNLKLTTGCFEIGCDASSNLAQLCAQRNVEVMVADCLKLPLRSNCVDIAISIAVIHHMSTKARRIDAMRELLRVLRIGGKALVYVWAFEQDSVEGPSNYLKAGKDNTDTQFSSICEGVSLPVHKNRTDFVEKDILVPWKDKENNGEVHHRFYHVFSHGELEKLVEEAGGTVISSYHDKGNWCVVLQKNGPS